MVTGATILGVVTIVAFLVWRLVTVAKRLRKEPEISHRHRPTHVRIHRLFVDDQTAEPPAAILPIAKRAPKREAAPSTTTPLGDVLKAIDARAKQVPRRRLVSLERAHDIEPVQRELEAYELNAAASVYGHAHPTEALVIHDRQIWGGYEGEKRN